MKHTKLSKGEAASALASVVAGLGTALGVTSVNVQAAEPPSATASSHDAVAVQEKAALETPASIQAAARQDKTLPTVNAAVRQDKTLPTVHAAVRQDKISAHALQVKSRSVPTGKAHATAVHKKYQPPKDVDPSKP